MEEKPPKSRFSVDWEGACTVEECLLKMILDGQGKSEEFKRMCRIFRRSREDVLKIWNDYKSGEKKSEISAEGIARRGSTPTGLWSVLF